MKTQKKKKDFYQTNAKACQHLREYHDDIFNKNTYSQHMKKSERNFIKQKHTHMLKP
jgi:hypothetical protein